MPDTVEVLTLDLLEWIGAKPRPYGDVMEAWRTSCPALPVWEQACDRGLVARDRIDDGEVMVSLTAAGRAHVARHRGDDRNSERPVGR